MKYSRRFQKSKRMNKSSRRRTKKSKRMNKSSRRRTKKSKRMNKSSRRRTKKSKRRTRKYMIDGGGGDVKGDQKRIWETASEDDRKRTFQTIIKLLEGYNIYFIRDSFSCREGPSRRFRSREKIDGHLTESAIAKSINQRADLVTMGAVKSDNIYYSSPLLSAQETLQHMFGRRVDAVIPYCGESDTPLNEQNTTVHQGLRNTKGFLEPNIIGFFESLKKQLAFDDPEENFTPENRSVYESTESNPFLGDSNMRPLVAWRGDSEGVRINLAQNDNWNSLVTEAHKLDIMDWEITKIKQDETLEKAMENLKARILEEIEYPHKARRVLPTDPGLRTIDGSYIKKKNVFIVTHSGFMEDLGCSFSELPIGAYMVGQRIAPGRMNKPRVIGWGTGTGRSMAQARPAGGSAVSSQTELAPNSIYYFTGPRKYSSTGNLPSINWEIKHKGYNELLREKEEVCE